jgi:hypothetical protein
LGNELAHIIWLQLADYDWSVRELVQQQTLHDAKAAAARAFDQALYAPHVIVVAAQLIGDVSYRARALGDYMLFTKHIKQVSARGTQITASANYRPRTIAARHMPGQEPFDGALLEQSQRKAALGHPSRKMRKAPEVRTSGGGRIPAALQVRDKSVGVGARTLLKSHAFGVAERVVSGSMMASGSGCTTSVDHRKLCTANLPLKAQKP